MWECREGVLVGEGAGANSVWRGRDRVERALPRVFSKSPPSSLLPDLQQGRHKVMGTQASSITGLEGNYTAPGIQGQHWLGMEASGHHWSLYY